MTFTRAEWCGHVYGELIFDGTRLAVQFFSYFEDESPAERLPSPAYGVGEGDPRVHP